MLEPDSPLNDPEGRTVAWFQNLAQTQPLSKPILIGALIIAAAIVLAKPIDRWLNPVGRYVYQGNNVVCDTTDGAIYRYEKTDEDGRPHFSLQLPGPGQRNAVIDEQE